MGQQTTSEYLTTPQVAAMVGFAPFTVYNWRRQGRGPAFVRIGRAVRYARADVQAWLEKNRIGGGDK